MSDKTWLDDLLKAVSDEKKPEEKPEEEKPTNTVSEELRRKALSQIYAIVHVMLGAAFFNQEDLRSNTKGGYVLPKGEARVLAACWLAARPFVDGRPVEEMSLRETLQRLSALMQEAKQNQ